MWISPFALQELLFPPYLGISPLSLTDKFLPTGPPPITSPPYHIMWTISVDIAALFTRILRPTPMPASV